MTLPSGQTRRWLILGVSAVVALLALVAISSLPGQSPVVFGQTGTAPQPPAPAPAPPGPPGPVNECTAANQAAGAIGGGANPNCAPGGGQQVQPTQAPGAPAAPTGSNLCNPAANCTNAPAALLAAIPNRVPNAQGVIVTAPGTVVTLPAAAPGAQCALVTATGQQVRLPTTANANGTVSCTATQPGLVTLVAGAAAAAPAAPVAAGGGAVAAAPAAALPRTGEETASLARWGILGAAGLVVAGFGFGFASRRLARKKSE